MQALVAYVIVALAALYAAWVLMPSGLRSRLIGRIRRVAPGALHALLERLAAQQPGCASCRACGGGTPAKGAALRSACQADGGDASAQAASAETSPRSMV